MILVLLMRKLVMLDKIHRTNLYFVRYTNVIIKNISIYQGEQNLGEKRQNSLMEFFKGTSSGICLFFILFWNEVKKPYSQRDTSKQSEFVNSWYIKYLLTKNNSVTRHVWLLKSSIIEKIGKKNILRYNDRIRSYQMNLLTVIITLLAPLRWKFPITFFIFLFFFWVNCILPHN